MNSKENNLEMDLYSEENLMKSNNTIHNTISNDYYNDDQDKISTYIRSHSLFYPKMIYNSNQNFVKEYQEDSFIKFTKFLPSINQTELLIITNNNKIQLHRLDSDLEDLSLNSFATDNEYYNKNFKSHTTIRSKKIFETKESNYIYDYDILWDSNDYYKDKGKNELYLKYFYICSKDNPVHTIDSEGKFCYSYISRNHVDEIINPISIKIDQYGLKLFCGFSKYFTIFDLVNDKQIAKIEPIQEENYTKDPSKISCFDFNHRNNFYLVGSYSGKIYLIDYLTNRTIFTISEKHKKGVNNLKFFNKSENSLNFISGGRFDNEIFIWDSRNLSSPVYSLFRENQTHQKLNFVIDEGDNYIYVANNDGSILVYDLKNLSSVSYFYTNENMTNMREAVSCVDFDSNKNLLVTASGARQFENKNSSVNKKDEKNFACDDFPYLELEEENSFDYNSEREFKIWDFSKLYRPEYL